VDLGDRVLGPPLRTEAVTARPKSASKTGSSISLSAHCATRSAVVEMPNRRSLPPRLGIIRSRTRPGENRRAFSVCCSSVSHPAGSAIRPCFPVPGSTPRRGTPGHTRGCTDHQTGDQDRWPLIGAASSASRVPAARPHRGRATARRYSPAASPRRVDAAIPLDPFAMWPAFPTSDYYGSSAPPRRHQPTTDLPAHRPTGRRGRDGRDGSHVHC
jgi:hypothetical protein